MKNTTQNTMIWGIKKDDDKSYILFGKDYNVIFRFNKKDEYTGKYFKSIASFLETDLIYSDNNIIGVYLYNIEEAPFRTIDTSFNYMHVLSQLGVDIVQK